MFIDQLKLFYADLYNTYDEFIVYKQKKIRIKMDGKTKTRAERGACNKHMQTYANACTKQNPAQKVRALQISQSGRQAGKVFELGSWGGPAGRAKESVCV